MLTPPRNAPWLFGFLGFPIGFSYGVQTILMPYLLRKAGVPVDRIAGAVAVSCIPYIWYFLWSPLADSGLPRRAWVLISVTGAGLTASAAVLNLNASLTTLTALLFLMSAFAGLLSSANGPLLAAVPETQRGKVAGHYNMGTWGAGAIGGGATIWLADNASLPTLAIAIAAVMIAPGLVALCIQEPTPVRHAYVSQVRAIFKSPRTWLRLLFFLSPVGSAAVGTLISGLGPDYQASSTEVLWVSGMAGGMLNATGSFLGGIVANRMNRMAAYSLTGMVAAAAAAYLALAPATPFTYAAGYAVYAIAAGFGWAVYTSLVLDVVGDKQQPTAAPWAILNAAGNIPIAYMTWLDGVGYKHWGVRGLMGVDAAANLSAALMLLIVAALAIRRQSPAA